MTGREQHLIANALSIAIAVMESVPGLMRQESDMADWEAMLTKLLPQELVREHYRARALQAVSSIGTGALRPFPPKGDE
jgi:hypothetical protein